MAARQRQPNSGLRRRLQNKAQRRKAFRRRNPRVFRTPRRNEKGLLQNARRQNRKNLPDGKRNNCKRSLQRPRIRENQKRQGEIALAALGNGAPWRQRLPPRAPRVGRAYKQSEHRRQRNDNRRGRLAQRGLIGRRVRQGGRRMQVGECRAKQKAGSRSAKDARA